MNRQTPTEPVTTEIKIWDVRPDPAARSLVEAFPAPTRWLDLLPDPGRRRVTGGTYYWQSHPIRYGLHEMGQLAESVRWNFPPLRPYGVTRERP